jgi:hypothetical protein
MCRNTPGPEASLQITFFSGMGDEKIMPGWPMENYFTPAILITKVVLFVKQIILITIVIGYKNKVLQIYLQSSKIQFAVRFIRSILLTLYPSYLLWGK